MMTSLVSVVTAVTALLPPVKDLPDRLNPPDPLILFDGAPVKTRDDWFQRRRPELLNLFRYYIYGFAPPAPDRVRATVEREDKHYFGGKATKREVRLQVGSDGAPAIDLLLIVPNKEQGPVPALVALNWAGNFAVVDDPTIPVTRRWMYPGRPGEAGNRAGEAARGWEKDYWCAEYLIDRGYALATFYNGDISPEGAMMTEGLQRHFLKPGQTARDPHDWGCIGAWAWGMSRVVDYLWTLPAVVDRTRLCAFGHSRHGKTALWAAAQDERFAMAMPHQSGTGGCSLFRAHLDKVKVSEEYLHWFAPEFAQFHDAFQKLPVDQHLLIALVAPRAVLVTEGERDRDYGKAWYPADPASSLLSIRAADPIYKFLGLKGLPVDTQPIEPVNGGPAEIGELMYDCTRGADHTLNRAFWKKILDRADGYWACRAAR
jgi:hypothetical protein